MCAEPHDGQAQAIDPAAADRRATLNGEDGRKVTLDWAFAGPSVSSRDQPRTCTWTHWLDSRTNLLTDGEPTSDSGTMYPQDDGKTLEKGIMVNPGTGRETEYEEVWEDPSLVFPAHLSWRYLALTHDALSGEGRRRSRGVIVQLGPWYQAIYRCDDRHHESGPSALGFRFARWKWDDEEKSWDSVIQSDIYNDGKLPTPSEVEAALGSSAVDVGSAVSFGDQEWVCRDLSRT